MNDYVLAIEAEQDLTDIWEYIAQDNFDAADRLVAELFEAFEQIARMPGISHTRKDLTQLPVLFWTTGAYIIIDRVVPGRLEIVAVTQGSRDIPSFLRRR